MLGLRGSDQVYGFQHCRAAGVCFRKDQTRPVGVQVPKDRSIFIMVWRRIVVVLTYLDVEDSRPGWVLLRRVAASSSKEVTYPTSASVLGIKIHTWS